MNCFETTNPTLFKELGKLLAQHDKLLLGNLSQLLSMYPCNCVVNQDLLTAIKFALPLFDDSGREEATERLFSAILAAERASK